MTRETRFTTAGLVITGLLLGTACRSPEPAPVENPPATPAAEPARSDPAVTTEIRARFYDDDAVRGNDLDVKVTDGMVVLEGTVASEQIRQQAMTLAQSVEGVRNVDNRIAVEGAAGDSAAAATPPPGEAPVAGPTTAPAAPKSMAKGETDGPLREAAEAVNSAYITMKIQSQYFIDDAVKGMGIDVTTTDTGVVTLEGEVESAAARTRAVAIARETEGVTRVDDQLRVAQAEAETEGPATAPATTTSSAETPGDTPTATPATPERSPVSDAWITMKVQSKYFLDEDVAGRRIDVETRNGVVALRGEVQSEAERRQAVSLARTTDGVKSVTDELRMVPAAPADKAAAPARAARTAVQAVDDTWVTTKIQSKYFLDEDVKGRKVDVTTRNGVVTLTGTVASDAVRKTAEAIAAGTDGVTRVVNQLKVVPAAPSAPAKAGEAAPSRPASSAGTPPAAAPAKETAPAKQTTPPPPPSNPPGDIS